MGSKCIEQFSIMTYLLRLYYLVWNHFQKHFREIDEMKKTEVTMKEQLEKKDFLIRRQADTIMAQKSELDRQKHTMVARTCNIL